MSHPHAVMDRAEGQLQINTLPRPGLAEIDIQPDKDRRTQLLLSPQRTATSMLKGEPVRASPFSPPTTVSRYLPALVAVYLQFERHGSMSHDPHL